MKSGIIDWKDAVHLQKQLKRDQNGCALGRNQKEIIEA